VLPVTQITASKLHIFQKLHQNYAHYVKIISNNINHYGIIKQKLTRQPY